MYHLMCSYSYPSELIHIDLAFFIKTSTTVSMHSVALDTYSYPFTQSFSYPAVHNTEICYMKGVDNGDKKNTRSLILHHGVGLLFLLKRYLSR